MQIWCYYPNRDEAYFSHAVYDYIVSITFGLNTDLSKFDQETIKAEYLAQFPELSENQIRPLHAILYHFAHTMQKGDWVVYPSTVHDRMIRVGTVTGNYRYVANHPLGCIHQRTVDWIRVFSRNDFSPDALKGISVNLALFRPHDETFLCELNQLMN